MRWPFDVTLRLPGSKSVAQRALAVAALSSGETIVHRVTACDDVLRMIAGLHALGFDIEHDEVAETVRCRGGLPTEPGEATLHCGNGGTALRFLMSIATLVRGRWTLDGDEAMRRRPMGDLVSAWRSLGVEMTATGGSPPIVVEGGRRAGGEVSLDASVSSQFLSSLLLVAPHLEGGLSIDVSRRLASPGYVALTAEVMGQFGHVVAREGDVFSVKEGSGTPPSDYEVEADWSAAGVWSVMAEMTGGEWRDPALRADSLQSDRLLDQSIQSLRGEGERVIDVTETPDQLMNLAILAARRVGITRFVGAENLRGKECDRLAVTARELERIGVDVQEEPDGLVVKGPSRPVAGSIDPEGDHRMVMAFAALGTLTDGLSIEESECVAKSYPGFVHDLERATRSPRCLALVGLRGAGKSTLGRALAEAFELEFVDTDARFVEQFEDIDAFVEREGWGAFRAAEERICVESFRAATVVALGGGAIESAAVRAALTSVTVIWVDESLDVLRERLSRTDEARPSVTGVPVAEEIAALDLRRRPHHAALADLVLPPGESVAVRIKRIEEALTCSW